MTADYTDPSSVLPPSVKREVERAADAMRGTLRDLGEKGREVLEREKERAVELEEGFEMYVQDHPIRSMLIAAGVGVFIGALICKR